MFSIQEFPQITLTDVFNQLSIGLNSSVIVTPNQRLAMVLRREFNRYQVARGYKVWNTPNIISITTFIESAYEEILYSEQSNKLPALLSTVQEQILWEDIISGSDQAQTLFAVPEAAKLAREAWQIIHEWQLTSKLSVFPLNDDCKIFWDWSKSFKSLTRREKQIDKARICDLIIELWEHTRIKKPNWLVCHGFDILTLQQRSLLYKLSEGGCEVLITKSQSQLRLRRGEVKCISCIDNRDEIHNAAVWARARIEDNPTARIGIVVHELIKYRSEITRIFSSVMEPDVQQGLPGSTTRPTLPFNISLGLPLVSYSLVSTAFQLLRMAGKDIKFESLSHILHSPFLVGGQSEMNNRALLDEFLREKVEPSVTLKNLLLLIKRIHSGINCPIFLQQLHSFTEFRKENLFGMLTPSKLARHISGVLQIFGFPGDRMLDSSEYQTLKKWHSLIADFAALDRVIPKIGYIDGISCLYHMAAETMFQPETPDVPIQILGMFESAGIEFDHLWVMGLSDTEWPLPPHTNSFLPVELQRSVKLPRSSAHESLELARHFTNEWKYSSDEVIFSYPKYGGECNDNKLTPSSLISNITRCDLTLPNYMSHRELICQTRQIEYSEDNKALEVDQVAMENYIYGGISVIKDHAACPFRAFALHRLGARRLNFPHVGLDTMERGILVHSVLAQAWNQLKTKSTLDTISNDNLKMILSNAAKEAIKKIQSDRLIEFSKKFIKLEHQRLVRLTIEWLNEERKRSDFRVIAIEDTRSIKLGGITLAARLDRVDELNDGRLIIIDYKTGISTVSSMCGERPEEPQLPLYLVSSEPSAVAVVFAQVKAGSMKFNALVRDRDILPGIKATSEWEELVASWRADLTRIAVSFSKGDAQVNPKKYPDTCRNCDIQSFCRIYERTEGMYTEREKDL